MNQATLDRPGPRPETTALETPPFSVIVRSFGITDQGRVRKSNEDNFLIAELARTLWVRQASLPQQETQHGRSRGHIFLVADGMGGHQAGEVASALTLASIETFVLQILKLFSNLQATDERAVLRDFQAALRQADARIFEEVALHPEFAGMGTTLTMALASDQMLFVIHAGDSRCYLLRGEEFRPLTADHTVAGELARLGAITEEGARSHLLRHVVTNVIGGGVAGVQVDVLKIALAAGDVVLLCSDGLTEMLADERIAAILTSESEPKAACERLVTEANEQGGRDNITAIVVRFEAA